MGGFEARFSDSALNCQLHGMVASGLSQPEVTVVVTDRVALVGSSDTPMVFVGSSLSAFMRVLLRPGIWGVLIPDRLIAANLEAIAEGSSVYSHCGPEDLAIDPTFHAFVTLLAHGETLEDAAREVGYSDRHLRRRTGALKRAARIEGPYPWSLLAPMFPR